MPAGVFIVNFEHISHLVVVFAIVNFEHVVSSWDGVFLQSLLTRIGGLNVGKCKPGKSLRGKGEGAWVGRGGGNEQLICAYLKWFFISMTVLANVSSIVLYFSENYFPNH